MCCPFCKCWLLLTGPLPLTFIAQALGLSPDCRDTRKIINKVNVAVSCLLYVSDDEVTVFHKSVIDWLLANGYEDHEYVVKKDDGCKLLWLMCEEIIKEIKGTVCSGHDLNLTLEMRYALNGHLLYLTMCKDEGKFLLVSGYSNHTRCFGLSTTIVMESDMAG